ncbi:putative malignant t cell amplified sequence 1 [Monocercomonoides exilis]|uniref:putative malignant t cell amplified sequence 1 n=1 Tax=Monocercomonoides exilis TaxID=2049356 RepID=UPI00355AB254|nr:putative malignant t cell amplified sequence 1 [Monocercomonoides exilis]|eukprot:MONOS_7659.1-p1 / transcript=MONOS_7659.1 / gene=MONOS_7659 / organism=Monocercomonoides_exilis_PA203 / gene_product=malignant t cell amplified sequence 1 / transcript_product=malignant t cell amplified sequence 1 / location=Mono_scaffold00267:46520-47421(-) / protein_length=181 / sequence_SO=supercontig / SO=protein_coding / is_pseudo=false
MFRRFKPKEDIATFGQLKTSKLREVRSFFKDSAGINEEILDVVLPKSESIKVAKCHGHINLLVVGNYPRFFQTRDGPYLPTLRVLHRYPELLPHMQVDRGAIKHILSGSDIMCRGLTSPGAKMEDVPAGTYVAIHAEGKEHAVGIGITTLSTEDIRAKNSGVGIQLLHHLGDALWTTTDLS